MNTTDLLATIGLSLLAAALLVCCKGRQDSSRRELALRQRALDEREKVLLTRTGHRAAEMQTLSTIPHAVVDVIILPLYAAADLYVVGPRSGAGDGEPDGTLTIIRGRN